jgi:glyoxylase-like metal-dependent hydrolase (beta-lactamase superfamily II)
MFERHILSTSADGGQDYLLICPQTRSAVLIDAGGDADMLLREIKSHRAQLRMVLLTHGHADRWQALGRLREALGIQIGIHLDDAEMLPLTPTFALSQNQRIAFGAAQVHVFHTPGHTPGSVCFFGDGNLFTGDVLAAGILGDASPPLGDPALLLRSLRQQVFTLPATTQVFPAHGQPTTLGAERSRLDETPSQ